MCSGLDFILDEECVSATSHHSSRFARWNINTGLGSDNYDLEGAIKNPHLIVTGMPKGGNESWIRNTPHRPPDVRILHVRMSWAS